MTNNSKALEESVRTIFSLPQIVNIERQILDLYRKTIHSREDRRPENRIRQLLMERKEMLDKEFVMNVGYQQLLSEFNDALRQQLITMHEKILKTYHALKSTNISGDLTVLGKCFLGYDYSKIHPVQTIRCKKIWYMLNGSLDSFFNERYDGGVCGLGGWYYDASYDDAESLDNLLYLNAEDSNWDDWFRDDLLTVDMQIVYPVHNLLEHTAFSIFDLLWVRDFSIEIWTELDYETDNCRDDEDLDFDLLDY